MEEPTRIELNSDYAIFSPARKLGQVEWDFVKP